MKKSNSTMIIMNFYSLYQKRLDAIFNFYVFLAAYPILIFNISCLLAAEYYDNYVLQSLLESLTTPIESLMSGILSPIFWSWLAGLLYNASRHYLFIKQPRFTFNDEANTFLILRKNGIATNELIQILRSRDFEQLPIPE